MNKNIWFRVGIVLIAIFSILPPISGFELVQDTSLLTPPEVIRGISPTRTSAFIEWKANRESNLLGYNIYRRVIDTGDFALITPDPIPDDQTMFTDETLTAGSTYEYVLTAVSDSGSQSLPSDIVKIYVGPYASARLIPNEGIMFQGETIYFGLVVSARNALDAPDGLRISVDPLFNIRNHLRAKIFPDSTVYVGSDRPQTTVYIQITASELVQTGVYRFQINIDGMDSAGIPVTEQRKLQIQVLDVSSGEKRIILWSETSITEVGKPVNLSGRLIPPPPLPATVSFRIRPRCGEDEIILPDISLDDRGYFSKELVADEAGAYCVSAFWSDANGSVEVESESVVLAVVPRSTRITCFTDLEAGETDGNFFGYIYPAPADGTPVHVLFRFLPLDQSEPPIFKLVTATTGRNDPQKHPGSYQVNADLNRFFSGSPVPGNWFVTTGWEGDAGSLAPSRSESLKIPFMRFDEMRVIIVAGGNPELYPEQWDSHKNIVDFVYRTFLSRGIPMEWITVLAAVPEEIEYAAGSATKESIRQAVMGCGANDNIPLHLYIAGPTLVQPDAPLVSYILNPDTETLNGSQMSGILNQLPENTAQFVYMDGQYTGYFLDDLCDTGTYRNLFSFSGKGQTPMVLGGNFSLSRYFFTQIRQNYNLNEAVSRSISFLESLPPTLNMGVPEVEIAGLPGQNKFGDCMTNGEREMEPLQRYYLGAGRGYRSIQPEVLGRSEDKLIDKFASETACQRSGMEKCSEGFFVWIQCEDPDEELEAERQLPMLVMVDPKGSSKAYSWEHFQPRPDGGFLVYLPRELFRETGNYSLILAQNDMDGNMSLPTAIKVTAINYPPEILLFGFGDSYLSTQGGNLFAEAFLTDGNGVNDIKEVYLVTPDLETILPLWPVSQKEDYAVYALQYQLQDVTLESFQAYFELLTIDGSGSAVSKAVSLKTRK